MKPTKYEGNGNGLYVEHHHRREGPKSQFLIMYKGSSRFVTEPIELSRTLGCARYTDASKALREWAEEIHEKTLAKHQPKLDMDQVKAEGFGPEAHQEPEEDPTSNTKMIT